MQTDCMICFTYLVIQHKGQLLWATAHTAFDVPAAAGYCVPEFASLWFCELVDLYSIAPVTTIVHV